MNEFQQTAQLEVPVEELRGLLLSDLARLVPMLPNVERIEPLSSSWAFGRLQRRDRWFGRISSRVVRGLVPEGALHWVVSSCWALDPFAISWELEPGSTPAPVTGSGRIAFEREGACTRVTVAGEIAVGGPSRVVQLLAGARIEQLVAEHVRHNVRALLESAEQALARARWGLPRTREAARSTRGLP